MAKTSIGFFETTKNKTDLHLSDAHALIRKIEQLLAVVGNAPPTTQNQNASEKLKQCTQLIKTIVSGNPSFESSADSESSPKPH